MSIPNEQIKRRPLTRHERVALERFARLKISLEELQHALGKMLEVNFKEEERRLNSHFLLPEPGVRIELKYVHEAMGKHARGEITTQQLSEWAAMLLLNDAYDWQGKDEDEIADWLNEISLLTLEPPKNPPSE